MPFVAIEVFLYPGQVQDLDRQPRIVACGTLPALPLLEKRLEAARVTFERTSSAEEAIRTADPVRGDVILAPLDSALPQLFSQAPAALVRRILVVSSITSREALLALLSQPVMSALLIDVPGTHEHAILEAALHLLRGRIVGIERYLADESEIHTTMLTEAARRQEAIQEVRGFLSHLLLDARLATQVLTALDELISNAFFNAPVDDSGHPVFAHRSRLDPVICPADRPVTIRYGTDGLRIALSVRDEYGSLERGPLVQHLVGALAEPELSFDPAGGGAGLGLVSTYHAVSQLVYTVQPRGFTECTTLVDLGGYREFLARGKCLQLLYLDQGENEARSDHE
jgi:hypothetical protein